MESIKTSALSIGHWNISASVSVKQCFSMTPCKGLLESCYFISEGQHENENMQRPHENNKNNQIYIDQYASLYTCTRPLNIIVIVLVLWLAHSIWKTKWSNWSKEWCTEHQIWTSMLPSCRYVHVCLWEHCIEARKKNLPPASYFKLSILRLNMI